MTIEDAVELIRPAISTHGGTWADLGAGAGVFTLALAHVIGPSGRIIAIDRDHGAVANLHSLALARPAESVRRNESVRAESELSEPVGAASRPKRSIAEIEAIYGDFQELDSISELVGVRLAGANFANALHYTPTPAAVLANVAGLLQEDAQIIVVEYDRASANRWVPYPITPSRLGMIASQAGLNSTRLVGRRRSAFGGTMYCAVLSSIRD